MKKIETLWWLHAKRIRVMQELKEAEEALREAEKALAEFEESDAPR